MKSAFMSAVNAFVKQVKLNKLERCRNYVKKFEKQPVVTKKESKK